MDAGPTRSRPRWRAAAVNAALVLAAFGLLGWTVWGNRAQIRAVFAGRPDPAMFVLALGVYLVAMVLTFVRWFALVRALGLPFLLRDAIRLGFIGSVFNLLIPGAVGGDLIKAAFLAREQERRTQAIASMVIDRLLGLLGLFLLASVAGAFQWSQSSTRDEVRNLILLAWTMVGGGVVGLTILFTPALYGPLLRLVSGRGRVETLLRELVAMASTYRRRPDVIVLGALLAALSHGLFVLALYTVDRALYPETAPSLARHYLVVPLVFFTMAVPLPFGALGLTEKASEVLFDLVGFPGGAVVMMGYRVVMYVAGSISATIYAANARQIRALESRGRDPTTAAGG